MKLLFAPMEGITGWSYRRIYEKYFDHVDQYVTPFLSPGRDRCFTHRELQEILPEHNAGMNVVPQLMTCCGEDFIWAAKELKRMGYEEVNLNLGCPSGTVVAKKKGSGFLAYTKELEEFLDQIFSGLDMRISVKTRIGKEDPEEFYELLQIYNRYPISNLIIHPRVQKEFYKGTPHMDSFRMALKESRNPVCYNGNLFTAADCRRFAQEFPQAEQIMLGRGLIANPALAGQVRAADEKKVSEGLAAGTEKETLKRFHDELLAQYREVLSGDRNVLFKMKELWSYLITSFADSEKYGKKIKKAQRMTEYEQAVEALFAERELLADSDFRG